MPAVCILGDFEVHKNEEFLKIAEELKPELITTQVKPVRLLYKENPGEGFSDKKNVKEEEPSLLSGKVLKKDDRVVLDFGDHQVGYVTLDLASTGSHQDAPLYLYLRFAERIEELDSDPAEYNGWISKSWLQQEHIHVDVLPARLELPRRYAFRYMEINVIDVSMKFSLVINDVTLKAVSAVSQDDVERSQWMIRCFRGLTGWLQGRFRTACRMCLRTAPRETGVSGLVICDFRQGRIIRLLKIMIWRKGVFIFLRE